MGVSSIAKSPEQVALILAVASLSVGILGCIAASVAGDFIVFFAFVEVTSISMFFVLALALISSVYPRKVKPEGVFFCGLGKPPYVYEEEVYQPRLPLLGEGFDESLEGYYDRRAVKVER